MAILGGGVGGAGNPVGGSFTGPAEALEIIGDHAYAYSGVVPVEDGTSADTTMLSFTSGNFYTFCTVVWTNAGISTDAFYEEIQLNGTTIFVNNYDAGPDKFEKQPIPLVIPPYTQVLVLYGSGSSSAVNSTALLTGRIYRTRD